MRSPSGEKAALYTQYTQLSWPARTPSVSPIEASQIPAVLSSVAATMHVSSGEKAALFTALSWPVRTRSVSPLVASQIRTVLSSDAVTMRVLSGEKAALFTALL